VLRVEEDKCEAWTEGKVVPLLFAPQFPSPRRERVSPGHLVAVATPPNGDDIVVWRWYDAVVLSHDDGSVRLWEPAHGEVIAQPRQSYQHQEPGSRAYASAGLPGADWWVAGRVAAAAEEADVELDAIEALYTENGLWPAAFGLSA
jgi:hypothetical protein